MKRFIAIFLFLIGLSCFRCYLEAQEVIVNKKDADFVFSLTRPQWERDSKRFFAPGRDIRATKHETGTAIMAIDPSTGTVVSVQPLYRNDHEPPDSVIIGNYFPLGVLLPMTDETKREMERDAQKDLGPTYSVRLIYTKMEKIEIIELILSKK